MVFGGCVVEEVFVGIIMSGVVDDFCKVINIVCKMVLEWGMGENFCNMVL